MLTLAFIICTLMFAGKVVIWALKAAWGISKLAFTIALLPVFLVCVILGGLIKIAFPFIIIGLVLSFFIQPKRAI